MVYPIKEIQEATYSPDDFEQLAVTDFSGGLNITDPIVTLPPNQFTSMLNYYFNRQGTIYSRPPYRPYVFGSSVIDTQCKVGYHQLITLFADGGGGEVDATVTGHGLSTDDRVTISGTTNYNGAYLIDKQDANIFEFTDTWVADEADADSVATVYFVPKELENYQVFRETLSNGWSYNDEVHVISGVFEDLYGTVADQYMVVVYNTTNEQWTRIWGAAASGTTSVSVAPYKINQAFDLMIFPNTASGNPERWSPSSATLGPDIIGVMSDVGLTPPTAADSFTATGTLSDSAEGLERVAAGVAYYKFAFFYDDANITTRYGESSTTVVTDGNTDTGVAVTLDATKKAKISIAFTTVTVPSTVSKVIIYRAPDSTPEGPYRLVGETEVTSTTAITTFVDTTPWDHEGVEDLPAGSNPSLSGSELILQNVRTVGAYLLGFDTTMPHKLVWSNKESPDVWNPLNFDYLDDTGKAAIDFNRQIYIFTKTSTYQKTDMDSAAIRISNIGCTDGRTLQDVGSGLAWMDYDTVYFADFVQQYGSKGDFPKDIGHRIASSVLRRDDDFSVSSVFFERRYYVTYTDTEDNLPRTYVYDVDIDAWTQHSATHLFWARGDRTLFSMGEVANGILTKHYAYEHDYNATVTTVTGRSEYDGKDYHDYEYILAPLAHWKMDDDAADTVLTDEVGLNNGVTSVNTNTAGFSVTGTDGDALDMASIRYAEVADSPLFSFFNSAGDLLQN